MTKAAYIVPVLAENRPVPGLGMSAVERCARSVLSQRDVPDLCIRFFDQGSQDGTFDLLTRLCDDSGLDAKVVRTPQHPNHFYGTNASLNWGLDWIIQETGAEFYLVTAGDDYVDPNRTCAVLNAWHRTKASWVGTSVYVERDDRTGPLRRSWFPNYETRWIAPTEAIEHQIGSSGSNAWSRELWEKHKVTGLESVDVILPLMSLALRGLFFIAEPLATVVEYSALGNLGMEGRLRGARTESEMKQMTELAFFQSAFNWRRVYARLDHIGVLNAMDASAREALMRKVLNGGFGFCDARADLMLDEIEPVNLNSPSLRRFFREVA